MKKAATKNALKVGRGGDRVFSICCDLILGIVALSVLYPLIFIVSASFSNSLAVIQGKVWLWPVQPTLEGYKAVFRSSQVPRGFINSIYVMGVGTTINVFLTILLAYPLSRKDLYGRGVFMGLNYCTPIISIAPRQHGQKKFNHEPHKKHELNDP